MKRINIKVILEILLVILTAISISFNIYFMVKVSKQDNELITNKNNTKQYQKTIKEYEDTFKDQNDEIKKLQDQIKELQDKLATADKCRTQQPISGSFTKTAYLTFDDGPSSLTPQFISVLNKCGVKGTFFVMGNKAQSNPNIIKSIISNGNQLGNHTYLHTYGKVYASSESFTYNLDKAEEIIYNITGITTHYFRFPGGSSTSQTSSDNIRGYINILNDKSYVYYDWNVTAGDSGVGASESTVLYNITNGLIGKKTIVVLMHDTSSASLKALPEVIRRLKEQGFAIKPLNESVVVHHNLK